MVQFYMNKYLDIESIFFFVFAALRENVSFFGNISGRIYIVHGKCYMQL
jgi:hypothetical protein